MKKFDYTPKGIKKARMGMMMETGPDAIMKYGPIQRNDYEHSFKYQMKKSMNYTRHSIVQGALPAH